MKFFGMISFFRGMNIQVRCWFLWSTCTGLSQNLGTPNFLLFSFVLYIYMGEFLGPLFGYIATFRKLLPLDHHLPLSLSGGSIPKCATCATSYFWKWRGHQSFALLVKWRGSLILTTRQEFMDVWLKVTWPWNIYHLCCFTRALERSGVTSYHTRQ